MAWRPPNPRVLVSGRPKHPRGPADRSGIQSLRSVLARDHGSGSSAVEAKRPGGRSTSALYQSAG